MPGGSFCILTCICVFVNITRRRRPVMGRTNAIFLHEVLNATQGPLRELLLYCLMPLDSSWITSNVFSSLTLPPPNFAASAS